jgi:His-Xaa-Ser system radical SAM maturase HxsC
MLLKVKGKAHGIETTIVGRITRNVSDPDFNKILILEENIVNEQTPYFQAVLSSAILDLSIIDLPCVSSVMTFDHLIDGDIIAIHSDGTIHTLYRVRSHQNFLLVTERCNSNCLMCSQPPKDRDDVPYLFDLCQQLIPLIPKDCPGLGITGGEPTLMGPLFFELLRLIQRELPDTEVHCLTNGRSFADPHFARQLGEMKFDKLMLGIPLYSDFYQMHDYIVQAENAFHETVLGLHQLALNGVRIEIRIVLQKPVIPRMARLAQFIYKNLPFVEHIAFMGLEYQGYTPHNIEKLWVDPVDYMEELSEAILFLDMHGMNVSIYNLQLCLMPEKLWPYTKKSISDWKNIYLEECSRCSMVEACGGLFASGEKKHSQYIRAFV